MFDAAVRSERSGVGIGMVSAARIRGFAFIETVSTFRTVLGVGRLKIMIASGTEANPDEAYTCSFNRNLEESVKAYNFFQSSRYFEMRIV